MSEERRLAMFDVVAGIEREARALAPDPVLDHIRAVAAGLGALDVDPEDPRAALALLRRHIDIDTDVPAGSRRRGAALVKRTVKRLIGWYVRYVGQQITLLGQAVVGLGDALVERTEDLDRSLRAARHDLDELATRVTRLEQGERSAAGGSPSPGRR